MDIAISATEVVLRLLLSVACGAVLGLDRELRRKPAGLRTHMMVSLGAAAFTLVSVELAAASAASGAPRSDPIRIVQGITAGIGFLCGASIVRGRGGIEGITTAADLWVVGAIGTACGGGYYALAGLVTTLAFVILTVLAVFERRYIRRS